MTIFLFTLSGQLYTIGLRPGEFLLRLNLSYVSIAIDGLCDFVSQAILVGINLRSCLSFALLTPISKDLPMLGRVGS
jgi:hypothetical protein